MQRLCISLGPQLPSLQPTLAIRIFLLTILMRFLNDRYQAGHMTALEAGTKPFHIPAKLASLHLSSSTRELCGAAPRLASLSWPLFRKHLFPPDKSSMLPAQEEGLWMGGAIYSVTLSLWTSLRKGPWHRGWGGGRWGFPGSWPHCK